MTEVEVTMGLVMVQCLELDVEDVMFLVVRMALVESAECVLCRHEKGFVSDASLRLLMMGIVNMRRIFTSTFPFVWLEHF